MTTLLIFIIVCLFVADIILLVSLNRIMGENVRLKEKYNKLEKRLTDKLYESVGIVPWDNLIVTYGDINGNIDVRAIEGELRSKLL